MRKRTFSHVRSTNTNELAHTRSLIRVFVAALAFQNAPSIATRISIVALDSERFTSGNRLSETCTNLCSLPHQKQNLGDDNESCHTCLQCRKITVTLPVKQIYYLQLFIRISLLGL